MQQAWVTELEQLRPKATSGGAQLKATIAFFSRALELAKANPHHAVLRYALKTVRQRAFPNTGWRTFQSLLLTAITADATTLPVVIVLLNDLVSADHPIDRTAAQETLEATIARHAPLGHGSEVAWALWAALQFGIELSRQTAEIISVMSDDIVALLALDAASRGLFPDASLDTTRWQTIASSAGALKEEHWLLAYEGNRKNWLRCPAVAEDSFFRVIESAKVSFYNLSMRLVDFVGPAAPPPGGFLGLDYG